jgi:hypothetical protein
VRGEESNRLGHRWLKETTMKGRESTAVCWKDLTECEKGREASIDLSVCAIGRKRFADLFRKQIS